VKRAGRYPRGDAWHAAHPAPTGGRRGEAHPRAKLTAAAVREIWRLHSARCSQPVIVKYLAGCGIRVSRATVGHVLQGRTWKDSCLTLDSVAVSPP
jgi:hypothetical protein